VKRQLNRGAQGELGARPAASGDPARRGPVSHPSYACKVGDSVHVIAVSKVRRVIPAGVSKAAFSRGYRVRTGRPWPQCVRSGSSPGWSDALGPLSSGASRTGSAHGASVSNRSIRRAGR